ncbi:MAG: CTP-dependent riboflavin kinase [Syntrophorhabdaceae bacterium]|nr:CTP-dependent riboflavin kinase [Syntrophorhabdaceae bacterium]
MRIKGRIVSGIGESKKFLTIDWVERELYEKLNFHPFPGTLNIRLDSDQIQTLLKEKGKNRLIPKEAGFCDALIFRGRIDGKYDCGIVLPLVEVYDASQLEVVAPVHIKDSLNLKDGDVVTLDIELD